MLGRLVLVVLHKLSSWIKKIISEGIIGNQGFYESWLYLGLLLIG